MGAIQNAANQLAQTGLGAAVAGKHLQQQAESIKEQEATKKLTGINAAAVTQSQLAENAKEYETNIKEGNAATAGYMDAWKEKKKQELIREGVKTDDKGRMRTEGGQFYSEKQLKAAITAERSAKMAVEAVWEDRRRIKSQRDILLRKGEAINEIYGEKVFSDPGKLVRNEEKKVAMQQQLREKIANQAKEEKEWLDKQDPKVREQIEKAKKDMEKEIFLGGKK